MRLYKSCLLIVSISTFFMGCANQGWTYYRAASKCHFEQKGPECNEIYEEAIKENDKLPGLHASYGVHLIEIGDQATGENLIQEEIKRFPESEGSFKPLLNPQTVNQASSTQVSTPETPTMPIEEANTTENTDPETESSTTPEVQ